MSLICSRCSSRSREYEARDLTPGGQASQAVGRLIREGFFNRPNRRSLEDVVKALESTGLLTEGKEDNISNILEGRVKKKVLKKSKDSNGWVYWTE